MIKVAAARVRRTAPHAIAILIIFPPSSSIIACRRGILICPISIDCNCKPYAYHDIAREYLYNARRIRTNCKADLAYASISSLHNWSIAHTHGQVLKAACFLKVAYMCICMRMHACIIIIMYILKRSHMATIFRSISIESSIARALAIALYLNSCICMPCAYEIICIMIKR